MILWDEMTERQKFEAVFCAQVKRYGSAVMLRVLDEIGFFEAPASTKYHGNYKGGLVEHSNNVCRRLLWLAADQAQREGRQRYSPETLVIVSLLHDVCKARAYRETAEGSFVYNTNDYPYGHGEKSVYMIMNWMMLKDEEALAIRWHMGAYDTAARSDLRELSRAMEQSKLVTMLHLADMMATHLDESEGKVWTV